MKSNKIYFIITTLLLWGVGSKAQNGFVPKVTPPSPNAASIAKFGDIPIGYYTGTPSISAPLYTIADGKLQVPIALNYHPSGIKVADEASQIGLGWALNAGGIISRTIMGEDDFENARYFTTSNNIPQNWLPAQSFIFGSIVAGASDSYTFGFRSPTSPTGITPLTLKADNGTANEYEPDQYSFSFPEGGGKFIITRDKKIILSEKSDIKVSMIEGSSSLYPGSNISWEITTTNGTKYVFDERETYYIPSSGSSTKHVSSWYLKSITPHAGPSINLQYNKIADGKNYPQGSISETKLVTVIGQGCSTEPPSTSPPVRTSPKYMETVYLDKINFTNGHVKFTYSDREDLFWDKKLDKVEVFKNISGGQSLLKTYFLEYGYFNGTADEDFPATSEGSVSKRLKLLSITEKAVSGEVIVPYKFSYFEGDMFNDLPAKTSFAIDHWGYYNGKTANTSLIPTFTSYPSTDLLYKYYGIMTGTERNSNNLYAKAFSLKRITYATGGHTEFDFESHDYDIVKSRIGDNSLARNIPIVEERTASMNYNTNNKGTAQDIILNLTNGATNYGGTGTLLSLTSYVRFATNVSCSVTQSDKVYFEIINQATNAVIGKYDMFLMQACNGSNSPCTNRSCSPTTNLMNGINHTNTLTLAKGNYICRLRASDGTDFNVADFIMQFSWYEPKTTQLGAKDYAGGLRVKQIIDFDGTQQTIKQFKYTLKETEGGVEIEKSSGRLMTMPQYTFIDDFWCVENNGAGTQYRTYNHVLRTSNSIIALNASASGSIVGYDKVTVLYGATGENGQSVYIYDNQSDVVNNYGYYRPPTVSSIPYKGNGSLKLQQDFKLKLDGGLFKVKEIENAYFLRANLSFPVVSQFLYGLELRSYPNLVGGTIQYSKRMGVSYPAVNRSVLYLQSTTERVFDTEDATNNRKVEKITTYTYPEETYISASNSFTKTYLQPSQITSTNSKNQVTKVEYKYPYDYSSAPYTDMTNLNIVSNTIEEKQSVDNIQVSKKLIDFQGFNSFYAPKEINTQLRASDDVLSQVVFNSYNTVGDVLSYTERNGISTTFEYYGSSNVGIINLLKKSTVGSGAISQTTTYDYFPLIGVKEVTDLNGLKTTYKYDGLGRLLDIKDNFGKLVKSYQYNYATPTAAGTAPAMAFSAQLDARNEQINLSFDYPASNVEVVKYEIQRGQGNEPLKPWVTVDGDDNTKIDLSYTPNQNIYKYEIRAILSNGTATEWKPLNLNLPNNCTGKLQLIKNGVILATKPIVDKACYELILDEGFETQDNADYTGEIEN